jgi:hypothetical protein
VLSTASAGCWAVGVVTHLWARRMWFLRVRVLPLWLPVRGSPTWWQTWS